MDTTIKQMVENSMNPEQVFLALDARPIPSDLDFVDLRECTMALVHAIADMNKQHNSLDNSVASFSGMVGAVAFGFYIGKVAERMSQYEGFESIIKLANAHHR